ncbi:hypothetical protein [Effusibacillus dendaii]|uniref:Metal-dependent hydrolase n=1 Tax=Effusibacillus dendaii TaxID=2743772 RepID=A0A7I8DA49_9BACL|nr:hypothetical protein [Effusibacillus dendaii]BCJ85839.1 hypothetical protein skT53_08240 [Effusibacillus dendaii]
MDTISHAAWTYLLTAPHPKRWYAVVGSILPDSAMMGMALVLGIQHRFDPFAPWLPQLFSEPVMYMLDSIWHSIVIWTVILLIAKSFRLSGLEWLVYGAFFHIGLDLFTHQTYIPKYLWPIGNQTIFGIVDYRNWIFMAADVLLLILFFLWRRKTSRLLR